MSDTKILRPTWAQINLFALKNNILKMKEVIGPESNLLLVIKANAYGHGATDIARFVEGENLVWGYGVSSVEEGIALRKAQVTSPILILGSLFPFESFIEAIKYDLTVTISSMEAAEQIVKASESSPKKAICHIKLETGMGRIGARRPSAVKILEKLLSASSVSVGGIYTHLSSSDTDMEFTNLQLSYFNETLKDFSKYEIENLLRHTANSYAAVNIPASRFDMVRSGFACYGLMEGFEPVLSLKTRIVFLKNVREGSFISYNKTFKCPKPMRIATLPIGYADGYFRKFSNKSDVIIKGKRCRVLGAVTMDMIMVDVSGIENVSIGDEAALIGSQGEEEIKVSELARKAEISAYEIVSLISARVPRVYISK
ncbi:MAG: alanine racemase [Elusimicrobiota bacterium]|nr:alanine racemase [Elusimicrobiota bacterium]